MSSKNVQNYSSVVAGVTERAESSGRQLLFRILIGDVIGHVTIWFLVGHFLLVVFWNHVSISNGFRNIQWPR